MVVQEGSSPSSPGSPTRLALRERERHRGAGREKESKGGEERDRKRERAAGTAGEGGLPTSDPADGGHMAAASQIKRLRLGGSAITAV